MDIIDDWNFYFNIYKKSNPFQKKQIKDDVKKSMEHSELAFIMGRWPPPTEGPENARKGEELGSFRKDLCKTCNDPIMARFWGTMFEQSIDKTGLCEKCADEGYIAELRKETKKSFQRELR